MRLRAYLVGLVTYIGGNVFVLAGGNPVVGTIIASFGGFIAGINASRILAYGYQPAPKEEES